MSEENRAYLPRTRLRGKRVVIRSAKMTYRTVRRPSKEKTTTSFSLGGDRGGSSEQARKKTSSNKETHAASRVRDDHRKDKGRRRLSWEKTKREKGWALKKRWGEGAREPMKLRRIGVNCRRRVSRGARGQGAKMTTRAAGGNMAGLASVGG